MDLSEFLYLLPGFWFYVVEKNFSPMIMLSDIFAIVKAIVISLFIRLLVYLYFTYCIVVCPFFPYKYSELSKNTLLFIMLVIATISALVWSKIKTYTLQSKNVSHRCACCERSPPKKNYDHKVKFHY